ncbi:hypothetical protein ACTAB1_00010 [Pseudomonas fragariae (ex Marin et al. 2024)]|uniref:hypothetical protein n=1 Tax=Pseudomonas fragariae (ex Marin et al. 2024) TaxID=3080056 RepID=UPI003F76F2F4
MKTIYPAILTHKEFQDALQAMKLRGKVKDYGRNTEGYSKHLQALCEMCCVRQSLMFAEINKSKRCQIRIFSLLYTQRNAEPLRFTSFSFRFCFRHSTAISSTINRRRRSITMCIPWAMEMPADYNNNMANDEIDIDNFGDHFLSLFSKSTATESIKSEFYGKENELAKAKSLYENLTASFSQFSDGRIPSFFIKQMSDAEQAYENAKADVDALSAQIDNAESSLEIYSYKDIIDLYSTDEGRLKLNHFFKSNGFKFVFNYEAKTRTVFMVVQRQSRGGTLSGSQNIYTFTIH